MPDIVAYNAGITNTERAIRRLEEKYPGDPLVAMVHANALALYNRFAADHEGVIPLDGGPKT